ncbi:MAG: o-succinylbenzoate synthase [Sphaerobacteraceae bacterium]|nr:MAG: o-succinylbenzoate synthase [Sphaerobacteraceae bacterium]
MIIHSIDYHHYQVPFRVPFTTSHGPVQYREGTIIRVRTDAGLTGYGESAPLPAFGTGSTESLRDVIEHLTEFLVGKPIELASMLIVASTHARRDAPVRFAFDTAFLDIDAQKNGVSISKLISPDAVETVPVNATISDMDAERAASAASYAAMVGFQAIKMKVGVLGETSLEVERVSAVREAIGPDVALRLDVNGVWTIDRAIEMARALEPYRIDYLEQPLPASYIGALGDLRKQINIPIAADETATDIDTVQELIDHQAVDAIVIKPGIIGGLSPSRDVIDLASDNGIRVVVTTALETGIAMTAALHLAATLPQPVSPCGLATGTLLETDLLVESSPIEGGMMKVPTGPGIGVTPVESIWQD